MRDLHPPTDPSHRRSPIASRGLATAALSALAIALLAMAAPGALALKTRPFLQRFGTLSEPHAIAIEQSTGDLYVADTGNNRVDKFDPSGKFLLAFGANVGGAGVNTCSSEATCKAGTRGSAAGQFTTATFLAVDNGKDASAGDVYVGDPGDSKVSKFTATGELVTSWATGGQLDGSATELKTFALLAGVAVDTGGNLFVMRKDPRNEQPRYVFKYGPEGKHIADFEGGRRDLGHGLAADASGNFFSVNGTGSIEKFTAEAVQVGQVSLQIGEKAEPTAEALAVDPATGNLLVAGADGTIDEYAFNGSGEVIEPTGPSCVVEISSSSNGGCSPTNSTHIPFTGVGIAQSAGTEHAYVSNPVTGQVYEYGPLVVVPDVTTEAPTAVTATTATLQGTVNPDGVAVASCEFEYIGDATLTELLGEDFEQLVEHGAGAEEIFELLGSRAPCEEPNASEIGTGQSGVSVHADVAGLVSGDKIHYRLGATNANGPNSGAVEAFETVTLPRLEAEIATNLTASSAVLTGKIDPGNGVTKYRFEYGTSPSYGTATAEQELAAGSSFAAVSQHISGLTAGRTYHWRVVASNVAGTTTGIDHTFIYATPAAALPDGRQYEMVTPPAKNGALIDESAGVGLQPSIAVNGNRLMAISLQCFAGAQSCNGQHGTGVGSPYAFTRTPTEWTSTPLAPPATEFSSNTPWGYDADTGAALFSMSTPPFGEDDLYLRRGDGSYVDMGPVSSPTYGPRGPVGGLPGGAVEAETSDFSRFVWAPPGPAGSQWPFDATARNSAAYELAGVGNSEPFLVGVTGGFHSTELLGICGTAPGLAVNEAAPGILSTDGRKVFVTVETCSGGVKQGGFSGGSGGNSGKPVPANELIARIDGESTEARTVMLSQRSPLDCTTPTCQGSHPRDARFAGASEDGSLAYFTDTQALTDQATEDSNGEDSASTGCRETTGPNGCNLYLYDSGNPAGHELVDASAGDTSGGGPQVQGVMAISADGSHVYFVARGVLAGNLDGLGEKAQAGADNLYLYERDAAHPAGATTFIATLPHTDFKGWENTGNPSSVNADGRFFVFLSHGHLTPDDTSASEAQQVFRYDAATATLIRISIGNEGFDDNGNRSSVTPCELSGDSRGCSEDATIAQPQSVHGLNGRRDPTMSDDGAYVFFTSPVALAPGALNDAQIGLDQHEVMPEYAQNLYEWHEGHVYLLSDGRDLTRNASPALGCPNILLGPDSSVCLLGADASGANVFFTTANQLVGQDTDTELDIYDARVCTATSPCLNQSQVPHLECQDEGCQGAPSAPSPAPVAGSSLLTGPGNLAAASVKSPAPPRPLTKAQLLARALRACRAKHDRHKRLACERQARKRYAPAKKASRATGKATHR